MKSIIMTNIAVRPTINPNDQTPVTTADRQALLQKLAGRGSSEIWINIEKNAFENSQGIKSKYITLMQHYCTQIRKAHSNSLNQTSTATAPPTMNNTVHYVNQTMNLPQQSTAPPVLNHPQYQLNHSLNQQQQTQPRFSSIQFSNTPRAPNPSTTMTNNQSTLVNQQVRLPDPQKFVQPTLNPISYSSTPPTIQTIDLSQTYRPQPPPQQPQPMVNATLNDYLSQPTTMLNRFPNQPPPVNQRARSTTNIPDTFAQSSSSTNSNNILQQYVNNDRPMNTNTLPITNQSSTGDRLLQQILLSNNNNNPVTTAAAASSNKMLIQNRQASLPINSTPMSQPIRSASTTNNNNLNSIRPSLPTRPASPSPPVVIMPTSNVQFQSSSNVPIQHSPLNNTNSSVLVNTSVNSQSPSMPNNNYSSPPTTTTTTTNRSILLSTSGSISSPDQETIQLIKYLKENISRLPPYYQKYTNEGNLDKARHIQAMYQQIGQFIQNPTYENLNSAKQIRDMLEKAAANRLQATMNNTTAPPNVTITSSSAVPVVNEFQNFEKVFTEFLTSDSRKRQRITQFAIEPLSDVINGVPHKKMRLDIDDHSHRIHPRKSHLSLIDKLNAELILLSKDCFSVQFLPVSHTSTINEYKDEDLNKNGLVLRCKLIESDLPLVPILRLRLFPRYPNEQPEILSLTKTHPPKLEFTNDHPFFEQLSTIFISHLFKLPAQHTVTDVLNLWRQSVRSAF